MGRQRVMRAAGVVGAGLTLVLSACGGNDDDTAGAEPSETAPTASETPSVPPTPSPETPSPTGAASSSTASAPPSETSAPEPEEHVPDPRGPVAVAVADLATATGVDPEDIEIVAYDPVTWRDGSLGCPKPGMMYTQALVDGYRIVLRAGGEDVHYHGSAGGTPFRCDNPDPNGAI